MKRDDDNAMGEVMGWLQGGPRPSVQVDPEPTHEYRRRRNELTCVVCGALRANPIHF